MDANVAGPHAVLPFQNLSGDPAHMIRAPRRRLPAGEAGSYNGEQPAAVDHLGERAISAPLS